MNKKFIGKNLGNIRLLFICCWSLVIICSLLWNLYVYQKQTLALARVKAMTAFDQAHLYRGWVSHLGGIYAPVSPEVRPNPYLKDVPDRDIRTTQGKILTLINASFMKPSLPELDKTLTPQTVVRLTGLNPLNPTNKPDAWEETALRKFQAGAREVDDIQTIHGHKYMRLIRAALLEDACLRCHIRQGLRPSSVVGGISLSVPLRDVFSVTREQVITITASHVIILLVGIALLLSGFNKIAHVVNNIKQLEGLIPICMHCKKIRDDRESWSQLEKYLSDHSDAMFTHGICPTCYEEQMGEIRKSKKVT